MRVIEAACSNRRGMRSLLQFIRDTEDFLLAILYLE